MNITIAHMGNHIHIHPEHAAIAMLLIFAFGLLALAIQNKKGN